MHPILHALELLAVAVSVPIGRRSTRRRYDEGWRDGYTAGRD
jgi:hypothetical protein